ncbi:MAG: helix-turn-helix domain-containing protein [Bacteroidales bacterium]|nr:helix-turn-helix domain-containing protein [Bacteroidales bacterium]
MRKRWIFAFALLIASVTRAQAPHTFTRYGRESGFAGTTVEDMAQDCHGQLWLATWRGLYSFDGRTFQNYRREDPDARDNPRGNRFLGVEVFGDGTIQVVSDDNRLYFLNAGSRTLDPVDCQGYSVQRIYRTGPDSCFYLTPDNQLLDASFSPWCTIRQDATVRSVIRDAEDGTWVLTDRGIYRDGRLSAEIPAFCGALIDGALYIGSSGGEVLCYQDMQLTTLPTQLASDITFIAKVPGLPEMLIGSDRRGLEIHNLADGSRRYVPLVNTSDEESSFTCLSDTRGNLWIYSTRGSLYWYDKEAQRPVPFLESAITSLMADRQGNLWIGSTWGGLERVIFQEDNFRFRSIDGSGQMSPRNNVRALVQEQDSGWILAATRDGRLHAFDERMQERAVWNTDRPGYAIAKAHDGKIWVGTKGAGLIEIARQPGDVSLVRQTHYPKDDLFYGPNSNDIYSLLEDEGHRLWIGTFDDGVAYVDLDAKDRLFISKKNRLSFPTDRRNRIRCLSMSPDGRLYAGGQMGLFVCEQSAGEPEEMRFERFTQIPDYDIQHILFTGSGELYVCSFGAGLLRFNSGEPDSGYRAYTTNDGMLSDYVLSAIEDGAGNLWIATQGGLNRLNLQTGSLIGFPYDRIGQPTRFNEGQPLRARDGSLYFNTTAGILYFDPQEISNSNFVPELLIEAFYVSGTRQPLPEKGPVLIRPSDGLRVQFAALDLTAPEQILYSYKLDGRDKDWIHLSHQATLSIPPLKAGHYTLRIRSTNGDGLQVDNEREIEVLVRNPFLRSGWAWLLYLLAASGVIFLLLRPGKKSPVAGPLKTDDDLPFRGLYGDDRQFVDNFLALLESRLDDSTLDVSQMSAGMSVSRSVLFEKCRTLLGATPAIILRRRRLEKARELIREGGRTMADIAYAVGVGDPHYFSKIFKQEFGMTPTEYRESCRREEASATESGA